MFSLTLSVLTLNVPSEVWVWLKVEAHWPTFVFLQKVKAVGFSFQTWTLHPFFFSQLSEICSVFLLIVNHTFWFCMVSRQYHILWAICMKLFIMLLYPCCIFFSLLCLPIVCLLSCLFFVVFLSSPFSFLFPHTPQPGVADSCLSEFKLKGSSSFPPSPIAHL